MFLVRPLPHNGFRRERERKGGTVEQNWFERLTGVMARMAGGDVAAERSEVRLLCEALDRVSRPAQQEVLFDVRMQAGQGDPSPAVTVGRARAVRPESVRQTCKRVLDKVRCLAVDDPYFAPLADL